MPDLFSCCLNSSPDVTSGLPLTRPGRKRERPPTYSIDPYFLPFEPQRNNTLKRASLAAASVSYWPASDSIPSGKMWNVHFPLAFLTAGPGAGCLSVFIEFFLSGVDCSLTRKASRTITHACALARDENFQSKNPAATRGVHYSEQRVPDRDYWE